MHTATTNPRTTPLLPRMDEHERTQLRTAAYRATHLYPGGPGDMLCRELLAWEEFGYRLTAAGTVRRAVATILNTPMPDDRGRDTRITHHPIRPY